MDHLPIPDGNPLSHLQVPYVDISKYEDLDFSLLEPQLIVHKVEAGFRSDVVDACIQEWLFFSLLGGFHAICKIPYDRKRFIRSDNLSTKKYLTTNALLSRSIPSIYTYVLACDEHPEITYEEILVDVMKYSFSVKDQRIPGRLKKLFDRTAVVGNILRQALSIKDWSEPPRISRRARLLLAATILHESLISISESLLGYYSEDLEIEQLQPCHDYLRGILQLQGWCPFSTSEIQRVSTLYITTFYPSYDERTHEECDMSICHETINLDLPRPLSHDKHSCEGVCSAFGPDEDDLVAILRGPSFPLLLSSRIRSGHLTVAPARDKLDFVAISHVWSHALHNTNENKLSKCQIDRLFKLAHDVNDGLPTALWIDTLCIPVSPRNKQYRKIAIQKMAEVYKSAKYVLIIDERLIQDRLDHFQLQISFLCSDWMRRLWTMQEALLPRLDRLYLQTGPDDVGQIQPMLRMIPCSPYSLLGPEYNMHILLTQKFFLDVPMDSRPWMIWRVPEAKSIKSPSKRFAILAKALGQRVTTRVEDEPICLATLLGLDLKGFDRMPRMVDIYQRLRKLPHGLIFSHAPRLDKRGFTWAPKTCLAGFGIPTANERYYGHLKDDGFLFRDTALMLDSRMVFPAGQRPRFEGSLRRENLPGKRFTITAMVSREGSTGADVEAIILFDQVRSEWTEADFLSALLVTNLHQREGFTVCDYVASAVLSFGRRDGTLDGQFLHVHFQGLTKWLVR